MDLSNLHTLTDKNLEEFLAAAGSEKTFRADLESRYLRARTEIEGVEEVMRSRDPVAFEPLPVFGQAVGHPPGARVLYEDRVYVNISRWWVTLPPHDCPACWALVEDEPAEIEPEAQEEPDGEDEMAGDADD